MIMEMILFWCWFCFWALAPFRSWLYWWRIGDLYCLYFQGEGEENKDLLYIRNTAHFYAFPSLQNRIITSTELRENPKSCLNAYLFNKFISLLQVSVIYLTAVQGTSTSEWNVKTNSWLIWTRTDVCLTVISTCLLAIIHLLCHEDSRVAHSVISAKTYSHLFSYYTNRFLLHHIIICIAPGNDKRLYIWTILFVHSSNGHIRQGFWK
jgi:hypothetical protein